MCLAIPGQVIELVDETNRLANGYRVPVDPAKVGPVVGHEPFRHQPREAEDLRGRRGREVEQGSQERVLGAGSTPSAKLLTGNVLGD